MISNSSLPLTTSHYPPLLFSIALPSPSPSPYNKYTQIISNLIKLFHKRIDTIGENLDPLIPTLNNIIILRKTVLHRMAQEELLKLEAFTQLVHFLLGVQHAGCEAIGVIVAFFEAVFHAVAQFLGCGWFDFL